MRSRCYGLGGVHQRGRAPARLGRPRRSRLGLDRFDDISRLTPVVVNVRPGGAHLVEHVFHAGGVPVVLRELLPLARPRRAHRVRPQLGERSRGRRPPTGRRLLAPSAPPGRGRARGGSRLTGSPRRTGQAERRPGRPHAPPRHGGRVRGRLRPGRESTIHSSRSRPTRSWCCATAGPSVRPGCRSGVSCRSRPSCFATGFPTWCGSRTRG